MIDVLRFDAVSFENAGPSGPAPWSFAVDYGQAVGLVAGPSEADAVVRLCAGAAAPAAGTVEVLGLLPGELSRYELLDLRRRMGLVLHREGLVSNLSLRDNLILPLVFGGRLPAGEARRWVDRALASLDLEAVAGRRPGALPREVRIVGAVARAALHGPELLVVDSLLGGLPTERVRPLVAWCRERCGSILLLLPGSTAALRDVTDRWVDPTARPHHDDRGADADG